MASDNTKTKIIGTRLPFIDLASRFHFITPILSSLSSVKIGVEQNWNVGSNVWVAIDPQPTLCNGQMAAIPFIPADADKPPTSPRLVRVPSWLMPKMLTVPVPVLRV